MENILKIGNGQKSIGTFCHLINANAIECLCLSGLSYLIIDAEHTAISDEKVVEMVRTAQIYKIPVFVRVKDDSRSSILRSLDSGATGIIVPNIKNKEEVKKIIEYAKFYPQGSRGFAFVRSCNYGEMEIVKNIREYFKTTNENTLVIPQCETKAALDCIEEIASLDGVDGVFVGPYDLSIDLGIPGQIQSVLMQKAIARILEACKKYKKISFIYAGSAEMAREYFVQGFDAVAIETDTSMLIKGYDILVQDIKN